MGEERGKGAHCAGPASSPAWEAGATAAPALHAAPTSAVLRHAQAESVLLAAPGVHDCAVLGRGDNAEWIAYVVPDGAFDPLRLAARLNVALDPAPTVAFTAVASLPLTPEGDLDATALAGIAVLDEAVRDTLQAYLAAEWNDTPCAVEIEAALPKAGALHLSRLLPEWEASPAPPAAAVTPARGAARPAEAPPSDREDPRSAAPLAVSRGGPLLNGGPLTLPDALRRAAHAQPGHGLWHLRPGSSGEICQTYPQLLAGARRVAQVLGGAGVAPGELVILQVDFGPLFFEALWGGWLAGAVVVPLAVPREYAAFDPAAQRLASAWKQLDEPRVVADRHAAELRAWARAAGLPGLRVVELRPLEPIGTAPAVTNAAAASAREGVNAAARSFPSHAAGAVAAESQGAAFDAPAGAIGRAGATGIDDPGPAAADPDGLALLLLTSGSTGGAKAVMLSHRNLLSMAAGTAQQNGFDSRETTLNWMPLDHVGAVSFLHTMPVLLGCNQVHVASELILQDPLLWLTHLDRHRVTVSWAPNFAFNLINERAAEVQAGSWDLSPMRFLVSAGEMVLPETLRPFLELLAPHGLSATALRPAFGMSETASGITWSQGCNAAELTSTATADLGPPIPGAELRIVDDAGQIVAEECIGRLELRGPSVTAGYYRDAQRTRQAFTADGWFRTGDVGFLRHGRLTLTGRENDDIILQGVNYPGAQIESAVESVPGVAVSFTAACAVRPDGGAEQLAVFFSPVVTGDDSLLELLADIRRTIATVVGVAPDYLVPLEPHDIPKTSIGKIQRSRLRRQFEAGAYRAVLQRVEELTGGPNTLPAYFHERVWRPRRIADGCGSLPGAVLIVAPFAPHDAGLGLAEVLRRAGGTVFEAIAGDAFADLGSGRFAAGSGDQARVLEACRAAGQPIAAVVHLATFGPPAIGPRPHRELERAAAASVLHWIQAAAPHCHTRGLRLLVVSSRAQWAAAGDAPIAERAALPGLLASAQRELPWLDARHVDLEDHDSLAADRLIHELAAPPRDRQVVWRHGERRVCRLQPVNFAEAPQGAALPHGGLFVISGGMGGIGVLLARRLLGECGAAVLLIGRRPADHPQVAASLAELTQLGPAGYACADVTNAAAIERAVAQAQQRWARPLAGAFHLAGGHTAATVLEETPERVWDAVAVKTAGAEVLANLLEQQGGGWLFTFGSVNGLFGGAGASAYAAANSALYAVTRGRLTRPGAASLRGACIEWSLWDGVGLGRVANSAMARSQGYHALSPAQGLMALKVVERRGGAGWMIGVDAAHPHMAAWLEGPPAALQGLTLYAEAPPGRRPPARPAFPAVSDRFGVRVRCRIRHVAQFPRRPDGTIDRAALRGAGPGAAAPRSPLERRLAEYWCELLNLPAVAVDDNFFHAGGNSLQAARVLARIASVLGVSLTLHEFFEHATVERLAALVTARATEHGATAAGGAIARLAPQELLADLEQIPDDQIGDLLARMMNEQEGPR